MYTRKAQRSRLSGAARLASLRSHATFFRARWPRASRWHWIFAARRGSIHPLTRFSRVLAMIAP